MAQPSISHYFAPKKRGYDEDLVINKKKVLCLDRFDSGDDSSDSTARIVHPTTSDDHAAAKVKKQSSIDSIRQVITPQRTRSSKRNQVQNVEGIEVPKVVNFYVGGNLSPQKKPSQRPVDEPVIKSALKKTKTATTETSLPSNSQKSKIEKTLLLLNNGANDEELKKKLRKADVLTRVNKLRDGFDKLKEMREKRLASSTVTSSSEQVESESERKSLKAFKKIELEILR